MLSRERLICCYFLARSFTVNAQSAPNLESEPRQTPPTIYSTAGASTRVRGRLLEDPATWSDANPLAALSALNPLANATSAVVPLDTPFGELMVPFSSLFSKGMRMLFYMVKDQTLPISQAELTALTTRLNDLAPPPTLHSEEREPIAQSDSEESEPLRGISFRQPSELSKELTAVELPLVLIGVDDDDANSSSRLVRSGDYDIQSFGDSEANKLAKAVATLGLARVWSEMEDTDLMNSLSLLDTSEMHESMKHLMAGRDRSVTPTEVKETLVKGLLATTTDTLPWLPLDGIVKSLPKFMVDRMGRAGELLGTLASYWKSGAETIDNMTGGILKPVLNNIQPNNEEDYTGRNGFVENVNVPDEDVSIRRNVVTGAGLPSQDSAQAESYPQFPGDHNLLIPGLASQYSTGNLPNPYRRRQLSAGSAGFPQSSSELFESVQKDDWMWSDLDADWAAPPFVAELSNPHLAIEQVTNSFSRSEVDLDFPFSNDHDDYDFDFEPQPNWDLVDRHSAEDQSWLTYSENVETSRKAKLEKKPLLDRLHEQLGKKTISKNRAEDHIRVPTISDDGPVSILRDFVKSRQDVRQDATRSNRENPSALERFRSERLGREKLIVGDDFDDEDELFDDEEDDSAVFSTNQKHDRPRRREHAKSAPARDLSEYLPYSDYDLLPRGGAPEYGRAEDNGSGVPADENLHDDYDGREFLQVSGTNSGGTLIGNMISSFIGGVEPEVLSPVLNPVNAATPSSLVTNQNYENYNNLRQAVERQKAQLDTYLEQMAEMYQVPGPEAEASALATAEKTARDKERSELMEEIAKKVSAELSHSIEAAEAQRAEDNYKLWEELDKERNALEQLLGENGTITPLVAENIIENLKASDASSAKSKSSIALLRSKSAVAESTVSPDPIDSHESLESPQSPDLIPNSQKFIPIDARSVSGAKLATIQDLIDQMINSISRFAPRRRLLFPFPKIDLFEADEYGEGYAAKAPNSEAGAEAPYFEDEQMAASHEAAPYEVRDVVFTKNEISREEAKNLNDWYDITDDWAGVRSDIVAQIASSVQDMSKTVHNNPLSDIVQSLIEGIVDANPFNHNDDEEVKDKDEESVNEGLPENEGGGDVRDRLAQSAASMLRQISHKVIKSGPRLKSSAGDLELKKPDPDPVKKSGNYNSWF